MKGLLIKDLCNLRQVAKQSLIVLAVLAAWCVFLKNYQLFPMMTIVYSMMLMFTAMSYDEMAHFDKYALTLPVGRRELVRTKYVLLLILFFSGILVGLLGGALFYLLFGSQEGLVLLEQAVSLLSVSAVYLLAFSVLLPIIFRLGMEKARLFLALIFVVVVGLLYGAVMLVRSAGLEFTAGLAAGAVTAGAAASIISFFASYRISVGIVKKKEW